MCYMIELFKLITEDNSDTIFVDRDKEGEGARRVLDVIDSKCKPMKTRFENGILVYMSEQEYVDVKRYLNNRKSR